MFSNCKTNNPASRAAAERVLPAPHTPLMANPVRPSHKARTIALRVASTCLSSSWRSDNRAACSAVCSEFSQQTVSIPTANRSSFSAAMKSFWRCLGPWGCILSVESHNTVSIAPWACARRLPIPGHFWCPACDRCFETSENAYGIRDCMSKASRQ